MKKYKHLKETKKNNDRLVLSLASLSLTIMALCGLHSYANNHKEELSDLFIDKEIEDTVIETPVVSELLSTQEPIVSVPTPTEVPNPISVELKENEINYMLPKTVEEASLEISELELDYRKYPKDIYKVIEYVTNKNEYKVQLVKSYVSIIDGVMKNVIIYDAFTNKQLFTADYTDVYFNTTIETIRNSNINEINKVQIRSLDRLKEIASLYGLEQDYINSIYNLYDTSVSDFDVALLYVCLVPESHRILNNEYQRVLN